MNKSERRVIFRHPRGIYETVEVSGTGVFGVPYCYRETVYTQDRDTRGVACKENETKRINKERVVLSTKEEKEICEMYTKDFSPIAYIATYKHRAPETIKDILARHKIPIRRSGPRPKNG